MRDRKRETERERELFLNIYSSIELTYLFGFLLGKIK
jgi:hypothetical protein